jgi:2-oxoglutarate dehydrogenase complex dehydrogenase (E1) component-like enzyme
MSGGYEDEPSVTSEFIYQVMRELKVDEDLAKKIIVFANNYALEKMKKWINNYRKRQKDKAEEIYMLTKKLKKLEKYDSLLINEIEKKILELCVDGGNF